MSRPIPVCEYCGSSPFLTYCWGFTYHVQVCRQKNKEKRARENKAKEEKDKKIAQLEEQLLEEKKKAEVLTKQVVPVSSKPKEELSRIDDAISSALSKMARYAESGFDVRGLKTDEDFYKLILCIEDSHNKLIFHMRASTDLMVRGTANNFMIHVLKVIREKMEAIPGMEGLMVLSLIKTIKETEDKLKTENYKYGKLLAEGVVFEEASVLSIIEY
jgi:hypothetical protein